MTGSRPLPATVQPDPDVSLHAGTLATGWCPGCKAWTQVLTELLLLTPAGVANVGAWTWCEVCEDPDNPLPARRIDGG